MTQSTNNNQIENWTDDELNKWFSNKEWLQGWKVAPDVSINKRTLAIAYNNNPEHWNMAFEFLKNTDLNNLPEGKQELDGEKLFISVQEYNTKEKPETKYEAHKKYIDIQYIISGEELMGVTTLDKVEPLGSYNKEKDLAFYSYEEGNYYKAVPENFFIFFPENVHRPCIKTEKSVPVKKLVVKLLID